MLAHSTSTLQTNQSLSSSMDHVNPDDHPSDSIESNGHNSQTAKAKKENELQQRLRSLKVSESETKRKKTDFSSRSL